MAKELYTAMYHYTRDLKHSRFPEIRGMDYDLFAKQLDFFKENFNVVTMEQVIEAFNSEHGELPEKALLLTFDDGYIDNFTVALPLLKERGMQGSFFIPGRSLNEHALLDVNKIHFILASAGVATLKADLLERMNHYRGTEFEFPDNDTLYAEYGKAYNFDDGDTIFVKRMLQSALPERLRSIIATELFEKHVGVAEELFARELYMNHDQIRFMKNEGMFIGLHGYDHYWMNRLTREQLAEDTTKALEVMGEFIDPKAWVINYPYGSYSDEVVDFFEKSEGCVLGLSVERRVARIGEDNKYLIPRFDCNDYPPKGNFYEGK